MAGVALKNYRAAYAKNIIWAFTVFYGLTFHIGLGNEGSDIVRYIEDYQFLHNQSLTWSSVLTYFAISGEVDILRTFIAVLVSRFTDHPTALTVVYTTIYGYFFSRNMWFILERTESRLKWYTLLMVIVLFLIIPIWNVNGFRMWTAAHIFVYGVFQIYLNDNKMGFGFIIGSIFVHFSFVIPVFVFFIYRLIGNRTMIFMVFFIGSLLFSEIDIQLFNNLIENYTPEVFQERTDSYRTEEKVEQYRTGDVGRDVNWYVVLYGRALKLSVVGFLLLIWFTGYRQVKANRKMESLYSFIILFYGVANFMSSIPSGGRYISVVQLLAVGFIVLYLQNALLSKKVKTWVILSIPSIILFIIVSVRIGFYSISLKAIASNPIISFFMLEESMSLNEALKSIF